LLKEYERIGERTLTVEEIKEYLMLESGKYSKYNHFKTRVINKALEEINRFSDLKVELIKENKERKKDCRVGF
jgi:plasmid replication initiation protein